MRHLEKRTTASLQSLKSAAEVTCTCIDESTTGRLLSVWLKLLLQMIPQLAMVKALVNVQLF